MITSQKGGVTKIEGTLGLEGERLHRVNRLKRLYVSLTVILFLSCWSQPSVSSIECRRSPPLKSCVLIPCGALVWWKMISFKIWNISVSRAKILNGRYFLPYWYWRVTQAGLGQQMDEFVQWYCDDYRNRTSRTSPSSHLLFPGKISSCQHFN